jgi:hypothetical protein
MGKFDEALALTNTLIQKVKMELEGSIQEYMLGLLDERKAYILIGKDAMVST